MYYSYQIIFPFTINKTVFTSIVFSTYTIIPAESSHTHSFNHTNLCPLIGYNRTINKIWVFLNSPNIPFWTIIYPFKTESIISCYTTSHMKAYQPYSNLLILTKNSSCRPLLKIFAFWFSDSIFQITNYYLTCCLNIWNLKKCALM